MPKRGISSFSMENLLSPVPKNFVEEPICVWQNFLHRKILGIRGGEGVSVTISRQNGFCLTVSNHFVGETFCVSESFGYRKGLCLRGDYPRFSMESLLSPVPEKLRRGTHLCFTDFSVSKTFRNKRGEGVSVTIFRQNGFCLTVSNYFLEEPICVSQKFLYRKILGIKGGGGKSECHNFPSKWFLSHSTKSFPRGNLLCFRKFRVSERFMPKGGLYAFFF